MPVNDEHIIEAAGRTPVLIRGGKVVSVGKPLISDCPLAKKFSHPVMEMNEAEIKKNIEERISSFGMCTKNREILSDDDFVLFGASELISSAIDGGLLDCAVIACDGAGTVIAKNPRLVQGIGGKMSGLAKTCPYPEVIRRINENGGHVVFEEDAAVDAYKGYMKAVELGFFRIAVTVACGRDAEIIRNTDQNAVIFAVHTTGAGKEEAQMLADSCDIVFACASKTVREIAGKSALLQGGISVPVYAMTQAGKNIILEKLRKTNKQILIKGEILPASSKKEPHPLI